MPAMTLTRVDLPAPLSPTSATTSPAWTPKSTSSSARTGPKLLLTPSRARTGVSAFMVQDSFPPSAAAGDAGAPPAGPSSLLDAGLLARRGVLAGAYLLGRPERVLHDGVVDVALGHRDRGQDHRRHLLLAVVELLVDQPARGLLALDEGDCDLGGLRGL